MVRSTIVAWALALLVAGCTTAKAPEPAPFSWKDQKPQYSSLTLGYSHDRNLEIRPCGCNINPLGGADREWNLIQKWKKDSPKTRTMLFAGGRTFTPKKFVKGSLDTYRKAAGIVARSLKDLGYEALFPGAEDFRLGEESLRKLQEQTGIPWVSANLYWEGRRAFAPYVKFTAGDFTLIATGLADLPASPVPGLEVKPPAEAFARVLSEIPDTGKVFLVVVTNLPDQFMKKLVTRYPGINLVLGGSPDDPAASHEQHSATTFFLRPLDEGREVARIEIPLQGQYAAFFSNLSLRDKFQGTNFWDTRKKELAADLKQAKADAEKERLKGILQQADLEIAARKTIPEKADQNTARADIHIDVVSRDYAEGKNALTAVVKEFETFVDSTDDY